MGSKDHQVDKVESLVAHIKERNPNEPEFLQAVREVATDVIPFIAKHKQGYLKTRIFERMCEPERIFVFRVPWINDKEEYHINRGYRIQMNSAIGPYKGGLRLHPSLKLDTLKFLAFEQIYKNSLTGLPLGAGKGGADFNPKGKSDNEIMKFCQSYMTELSKYIGADIDVPAGDIGTGPKEIGFMFGQFKRLKNTFSGVMTGKHSSFGGIKFRPEATGYGSVYFAEMVLKEQGITLEGKRCNISGSGNVALYLAERLLDTGAKVQTLSDSGGFVYIEDGLTEKQLALVKELKFKKGGRLSELDEKEGFHYEANQKPWKIQCEVAFPAAIQNEIGREEARELINNNCGFLFEAANMPCTKEANQMLEAGNVIHAPGKAVNAGGVAVSGLEMSQNNVGIRWGRKKVDRYLHKIMQHIHDSCLKFGKADGHINYRKGANIAGFMRVAQAMSAQGLV